MSSRSVSTTLYRFQIELSDIDRAVYETIDLRIAQHPSETDQYLMPRVLAYSLNHRPGLEFSPGGLSDPDVPAMSVPGSQGGHDLWIEIGNPSPRKLHKASKSAKIVKVYTYKDANLLVRELSGETVHRKTEIEIYSFQPKFLDRLAESLEKSNRWSVMVNDGTVTITNGPSSESGEITRHQVPS